jgi:hypothetical protein
MRDRRGRLPPSAMGQLGKQIIGEGAGYVGKRISVEKQEGSSAMAGTQVIERLGKSRLYCLPFLPVFCD